MRNNSEIVQKTESSDKLRVVSEDRKLAMRYATRFFLVSITCQVAIFLIGWFTAAAIFHVNPSAITIKQIIFVGVCAIIGIMSSYRSANKLYREYMSDKDVEEFI